MYWYTVTYLEPICHFSFTHSLTLSLSLSLSLSLCLCTHVNNFANNHQVVQKPDLTIAGNV